ncbi:MAG: DMT family transporter [Acidothermus cellulolyticus]|nr:DMT family transporter [Acidothermus cellulolyticus]
MAGVALLALGAAFLFALAAVLQARAARVAGGKQDVDVATFVQRLIRDRGWLLGWLANLAGFFTQTVALHFGSVAVVQPLLVSQLLFTLILSARAVHREMGWREWLGGLAICGGLAILLSVRGALPAGGEADRTRLLAIGPLVGGAAAALALGAMYRRRVARSIILGTEAGLFFACGAVLNKLTSDDLLHRGVAATATDWVGYGLAIVTVLGFLVEQRAFAAGPLPAAMTAMTITNPIVSYIFAVVAFGVALPHSPAALAGIVAGGTLLYVGVGLLAPSPLLRRSSAADGRGAGTSDGALSRCEGPPPSDSVQAPM